MAFTITTFSFSKRANSTKQPTGLSGTDWSVVLKDKTSYDQPVFLLSTSAQPEFNYVKWGSWYYFVIGISYVRNDLYEVSCNLDVLATYKTEIGASSAYVLYDTTANVQVVDRRLSTVTNPTVTQSLGTFTTLGSFDFPTEFPVIIGVTSKYGYIMYAITANNARRLLANVEDEWLDDASFLPVPDVTDWSTLEDAIGALVYNVTVFFRQFFATGKVSDNVHFAIQVPWPLSAISGQANTPIYLGSYDTGQTGIQILTGRVVEDSATVSIPWQFTDWRNNPPYTNLYLYNEFLGIVPLPTSELIGYTQLRLSFSMDLYSGDAIFILYAVANGSLPQILIGKYAMNIGSAFPMGASVSNLSTAGATFAAGGLAAGAAIVTGGFGAPAAAALGASAISGISALNTPISGTVGGGGGAAVMANASAAVRIFSVCHPSNVDPATVSQSIGTPAMAQKQIGTLTGFLQTSNASVEVAAEQPVRDKINSLLDGGIFYE